MKKTIFLLIICPLVFGISSKSIAGKKQDLKPSNFCEALQMLVQDFEQNGNFIFTRGDLIADQSSKTKEVYHNKVPLTGFKNTNIVIYKYENKPDMVYLTPMYLKKQEKSSYSNGDVSALVDQIKSCFNVDPILVSGGKTVSYRFNFKQATIILSNYKEEDGYEITMTITKKAS